MLFHLYFLHDPGVDKFGTGGVLGIPEAAEVTHIDTLHACGRSRLHGLCT